MPWHYRQHDAKRLEDDKTLAGLGLDGVGCEKALGILGVVVAGASAFLDLGNAVADRLSHFTRHHISIFAGVFPQHLRRLAHQAGAARKACSSPIEKRIMRLADSVSEAVIRHLLITRKCLACGGIDRFDRHRLSLSIGGARMFRRLCRGWTRSRQLLNATF